MLQSRALVFARVCALAALPVAGIAQCGHAWDTVAVPGVDGAVHAITSWDPDGAGPAASKLAVGGSFVHGGSQQLNRVALLDPATGAWSPLVQGVDGPVRTLAVTTNGELVVGGDFGGAYGTICSAIVRWNGTAWAPLGTGLGLSCRALLPLPGGELIATGIFASAGGTPAAHIARWNGTTWSALGSGLGGAFPIGEALARLPNGDVVVAGDFVSAGGVAAAGIARWNGVAWTAMPGLPPSPVTRLAVLPNGDLIANPGGALWRWSGGAWSQLATVGGFYAAASSLDVLPSGDLVVGGEFLSLAGVAATNLARWDGVAWHALGDATNPKRPLTVVAGAGNELFAGGGFAQVGAVVARSIARWTGAQWQAIGTGVGVAVIAQTVLPDGRDVVLTSDYRVFRRDGAEWTALGDRTEDWVMDVAALANGDLVIGGQLVAVGLPVEARLRRWNGTTWQPFGGPLTNTSGGLPFVARMLPLPDGRLVAGGSFTYADGQLANNVAIWNGTVWMPLQQGVAGQVNDLVRMPNGDIAVGGSFLLASGVSSHGAARWNGSAWSAFGTGPVGTVWRLAALPNGGVAATGYFTVGSVGGYRVMGWNGAAWAQLGNAWLGGGGWASAVVALPNGDVVTGGSFTSIGGTPTANLARWDGVQWNALANGVSGTVRTLALQPTGRLAVGGEFARAGGNVSPFFAWLRSTCPATAADYGTGCTGTGGSLALVATELPWLGGTLRATATGLVAQSIAVHALGFAAAAVPLATLHPAGGAGCTLLVDPHVLEVLPAHTSSATTAVAVPLSPALVGAVVRTQLVEIELAVGGAILRLNATNGLAATLGRF